MYTISIDKIILDTPYNEKFVSDLKSQTSSRKWDTAYKFWVVNIDERETVERLLRIHFNYLSPSVGVKTVKITAKEEIISGASPVMFRGFPICTASGRDSGARVCNNVTLLSGKITSGGSVKNWCTVVKKEASFRVKIPAGVVIEEHDEWEVIEIEEHQDNKKLILEKRREELLKELAEIEKQLSEV